MTWLLSGHHVPTTRAKLRDLFIGPTHLPTSTPTEEQALESANIRHYDFNLNTKKTHPHKPAPRAPPQHDPPSRVPPRHHPEPGLDLQDLPRPPHHPRNHSRPRHQTPSPAPKHPPTLPIPANKRLRQPMPAALAPANSPSRPHPLAAHHKQHTRPLLAER